jgi:hypothetical protein
MLLDEFPTTHEISDIFAAEIAAAGGVVSDTFNDGRRLFARSVLPRLREVATGDKVQGGVALMAVESQVSVHPYVFRLVCKNGAIAAQAIESRTIECGDFVTPEEVLGAVRDAIVACCADEAFAVTAQQMRSARDAQIDIALNVIPFLDRLPRESASQIFIDILERFGAGRDRSRFAFLNAVTSVARDTADPEVRWRLEELGGGVCAGIEPELTPLDGMGLFLEERSAERRRMMGVR